MTTVTAQAVTDNDPEILDEAAPRAVVAGSPWQEWPEDLYIPPDALEVFLETFEGPLDLLWYLIKKQNIDILNIPIAQITRQYLDYIEMMQVIRLELAADYLVMAAWLAEIKSRLLLPRPPQADEPEADPRTELLRRLQEYEQIKIAAGQLDGLPREERDVFPIAVDDTPARAQVVKPLPQVELREMLSAFQAVLRRAEQRGHHHIVKEPLSVRDRMAAILEHLNHVESLNFSGLFRQHEGKHGAVVAFLAILELCKQGLIEIFQPAPLAELRVRALGMTA